MAKVIAVVGAGGKTTRIHNLTKQYREEGKRKIKTHGQIHCIRKMENILLQRRKAEDGRCI